jgi:ribose 5-phosphate isomerase A
MSTQPDADRLKRAAARAAVAELPASGIVGLGSGSTIVFFLEAVAELVREGRDLVGVPTSQGTRSRAAALGIPLLSDDGPWDVDVTVDGADELDPRLDAIKGGGAAHAREKIVNQASRRNVIVVDERKLSARLGTSWPVPIEVLPFGHASTARSLARFGTPVLRAGVTTDAGNVVYDLATGPIEDAAALEGALARVPGVAAVGLFVGRIDVAYVAGADGVRRLVRP